jgi:ABC-type sugar transport system permease subunit
MGRASACALILFIIIFICTMVQRRIGASKTIDYE